MSNFKILFVGFVLSFGLSSILNSASAGVSDQRYSKARARYFSAKSLEPSSDRDRQFRQAASELREFLEKHPGHPKVVEALFNLGSIYQTLGQAHQDRNDAGRSLHFYRRLVKEFPTHHLADDSLFQIAAVCRSIFQDYACANQASQTLLRKYPKGDMASKTPKVSETMGIKEASNSALRAEQNSLNANLNEVKLESESGMTRVRVKLDQPRKAFSSRHLRADASLGTTDRFFLDIPNTTLSSGARPIENANGPWVQNVRLGQFSQDTVRVVLDLSRFSDGDVIQTEVKNNEIWIEIRDANHSPASLATTIETKELEKQEDPIVEITSLAIETSKKSEVVTPAPLPIAKVKEKQKKFRVIIDPGHGGDDPGAIGKHGTKEKEICLQIAKKVASILGKKNDYEVILTREHDRFISLADRTRFANENKGDLFISIHANASPKRSARGVSTYFLDNADDEDSLRVAMRENGELSVEQLTDQGPKSDQYFLQIMKASMEKNFHTSQSTDLARTVQRALLKNLKADYRNVRDLGVRSARFYVLTGVEMPAILVETSFISNPDEEQRLRSNRYQWKVSRSIVDGIEAYLKEVSSQPQTAFYNR